MNGSPLLFLLLVFKASLFSTGGFGNVPSLHDDLIAARGWATERQFAAAFAVGQVSPGPNGLWVISLGYLLDGLRGALLALVAIVLPPLLVVLVDRLYRRVSDHPATVGFVRGLSLAVVGTFVVVLSRLLRGGAAEEAAGVDVGSIVLAVGAAALALSRRVPVIVILALAALAGVVLHGR